MIIWQVVYYYLSGMLLYPSGGNSLETGTYIFGIYKLAAYFGLFYLSPRAVFLTEDRKYLST